MTIHFDIDLTPKQKEAYELVHDPDVKEVVLLFSRQSGKTILAELLMMEAALTGPRQTVFYISPTYAQGKKVFREIVQCLDGHNIIKKKNASSLSIELVNHSVIQFFTTKSPTSIRGNTCTKLLVLDELAFFPETTPSGEDLYHNVIYPITKTHRPKIINISTPAGKQGIFYEKWMKSLDPDQNEIRGVKSTIYQDQFINKTELRELRNSTPPLAWRQEFECEFLDSALTALEGFEKCFVPDNQATIDQKDTVWMGLDFSSVGSDETILSIVNNNGHVKQHRIYGNLDEKYTKIARLIDSYPNLMCCYAESNSIGEPMLNEVKKKCKQKSKIRPFLTTHQSKNDMVGLLQTKISSKFLVIPESEKALRFEMGVFTYTISKTKTITFAAKPPYHDDRVMALGLSMMAREDYRPFSVKKDTVFVRTKNMAVR